MSRDRTVGDTFFILFTTRAFATGIPTVLAGSPVVSAYEDSSATQITAGITLGVSHDGVVGLNLLTIVATGGNGFESGKDYNLVITTGTVGGVSVVGEVVGDFSLDLSAALKAVDLLNDVAATDIVSAGAITTSSGSVSSVTTVATTTTNSDMRGTDGVDTATMRGTDSAATAAALATVDSNVDAILLDTAEIGTAGAGLTNINLPNQTMDIVGNITGNLSGSVGSVTAGVTVTTNSDKTGYSISGVITTLDGLNNFNASSDAVANVTLVATTTTNSDMRGTDSALLAASINLTAGAVDNVTLVATTTTNSDMRGTDSAATASALATVDSNVDAILVDTSTTLPDLIDDLAIKKNTAFSNFEFLVVLTSDHVTPATGLTVTGQRSIDGGAFTAVAGTIAEVSNGIYQFDALAADTNGDFITWRFSSATADDVFVGFKTVQ